MKKSSPTTRLSVRAPNPSRPAKWALTLPLRAYHVAFVPEAEIDVADPRRRPERPCAADCGPGERRPAAVGSPRRPARDPAHAAAPPPRRARGLAPIVLLPGDRTGPRRSRAVRRRPSGGAAGHRSPAPRLHGYLPGRPDQRPDDPHGRAGDGDRRRGVPRLGARKLIRVGTCGGMGTGIRTGDIVIATAAAPFDGTTGIYLHAEPYAPSGGLSLTAHSWTRQMASTPPTSMPRWTSSTTPTLTTLPLGGPGHPGLRRVLGPLLPRCARPGHRGPRPGGHDPDRQRRPLRGGDLGAVGSAPRRAGAPDRYDAPGRPGGGDLAGCHGEPRRPGSGGPAAERRPRHRGRRRSRSSSTCARSAFLLSGGGAGAASRGGGLCGRRNLVPLLVSRGTRSDPGPARRTLAAVGGLTTRLGLMRIAANVMNRHPGAPRRMGRPRCRMRPTAGWSSGSGSGPPRGARGIRVPVPPAIWPSAPPVSRRRAPCDVGASGPGAR